MRGGITAIGSCSYRSGSGHGASPSTRRRDGLRRDHTQSAQLGRCRRTDKTGSFNALVRLTFEQLPVGGGCGRLGGFARLALQVYGKIRVPLIAEPLIFFTPDSRQRPWPDHSLASLGPIGLRARLTGQAETTRALATVEVAPTVSLLWLVFLSFGSPHGSRLHSRK